MMRPLLYVAALAMVCLVAVWAYKVVDGTRDLRADVQTLHERIAEERRALSVMRAEWAWLNRPERLARLVAAHEAELGLSPMTPAHFSQVAAVAFQPPPPHPPAPPPEAASPPAPDAGAPVAISSRAAPARAAAAPAPAPGAPAAAVVAPRRAPPGPGLRLAPRPPGLAAPEPQVTILALAGRDWLALGLTLPPERPARP